MFLEARARGQTTNITQVASNPTDVEMATSSQSLTNESTSSQSSIDLTSKSTTDNQVKVEIIKPITSTSNDHDQSTGIVTSKPCVLCLKKERKLACIPCGHLATCIECGQPLQFCPICGLLVEKTLIIYR